MAALSNSGKPDKGTEEFEEMTYLSFPQSPPPFPQLLPLTMENPQQNQQYDDINDQQFSLNGDSFLLQLQQQEQELLEQCSNASDLSWATDLSDFTADLSGATDLSDFTADLSDFTADDQEVGNGFEGTGEGEMEVGMLNSGCLVKRKSKRTPRGENGNKKKGGFRIAIGLEDLLQKSGMRLKDAAKNFDVSPSTLKRVCREHNIHKWPPKALPSNQASASTDTDSVVVKAKHKGYTIKFQLSSPWEKAKLEEKVARRLKLEAGTYDIMYKDEEDELILIACDEDLQYYITSCGREGTSPIKLFLEQK